MHVEWITVRPATAHLERPKHVAAGRAPWCTSAPGSPAAGARISRPATARASAAAREERLEDAGREKGREAVVRLVQPESVQMARRGLQVVAGAQRHGFALRPAERLAVEAVEVLEVARVEMRADAAARAALGHDEQELAVRVRVAREEHVAAEPIAATVENHIRRRRDRQFLVRDARGRTRRRLGGDQLKVTRQRRERELAGRNLVRNAVGNRRAVVRRPHRHNGRARPAGRS